MGDRAARRWRWLGTVHAWRTRGRDTLQPLEQPVKIAVIGAPSAHYLGLSSGWSVLLAALFVLAWEVAMLVAGAFDYRAGVIERQMALGNAQDPWKVAVLDRLRDIFAEVHAARVQPPWRASNGYEERARQAAGLDD